VRVPGKCRNSECTSGDNWVDYDTELCRKCEIDRDIWGHNGVKAEEGSAVQTDSGVGRTDPSVA
jgi:hypothetical protein